MRMHEEEVEISEAGKPSENGEPSNQSVQETPDLTVSQKYRELRSKLKYLIYVSVEFVGFFCKELVVTWLLFPLLGTWMF